MIDFHNCQIDNLGCSSYLPAHLQHLRVGSQIPMPKQQLELIGRD